MEHFDKNKSIKNKARPRPILVWRCLENVTGAAIRMSLLHLAAWICGQTAISSYIVIMEAL
jgi:hypothetical protein